jgi:hypothetical protein
MFRAIRKKIFRLIVVSGAGAAATYFFDRENGPERRAMAKDRANDLLGRATAGGSWQPQAEHNANGFEPGGAPAAPGASGPASGPVTAPYPAGADAVRATPAGAQAAPDSVGTTAAPARPGAPAGPARPGTGA